MKKIIILIIGVLIVYFGLLFIVRSQNIFCGGFAGKSCPKGFVCEYEGDYPDAGGKCVLIFDFFRFLK